VSKDEVPVTRRGKRVATVRPVPTRSGQRERHWCAFCGKSENEVTNLILGVSTVVDQGVRNGQVAICGECVNLCNEIIADNELN
jgi:hypothetical protein